MGIGGASHAHVFESDNMVRVHDKFRYIEIVYLIILASTLELLALRKGCMD